MGSSHFSHKAAEEMLDKFFYTKHFVVVSDGEELPCPQGASISFFLSLSF